MKKTLAAATLAAVFGAAGAASAADLSSGGGLKDTGYVPGPLWSGFYIGINGGFAWDQEVNVSAFQEEEDDPAASKHADGGFGGGQIGYNIQRDRLVFGIETDIQGAGVSGSATAATSPRADDAFSVRAQTGLDFFGTVRGRLGLTFPDPGGLVYVTGGFAYGGVRHKLSGSAFSEGDPVPGSPFSLSHDSVQAGWVLGAGYERFITNALSLKLEYQFIDLGSDRLSTTLDADDGPIHAQATFHDAFSTVRVGLNYHLAPAYEPLK